MTWALEGGRQIYLPYDVGLLGCAQFGDWVWVLNPRQMLILSINAT